MADLSLSEILLQRESGNLRWLTLPAQSTHRERVRALVRIHDGSPADALPVLRRLAGRPEAGWWDKHNLGALLLVLGDHAAAIKWLRRARAECGGSDEMTAYALALAHALAGDGEAVREVLAHQAGKRSALVLQALQAEDLAVAAEPALGGGLSLLLDRLAERALASHLPLSIAYLAIHTGITGGSKVLFEHANWLTTRGHRVVVFSQGERPTWFPLQAAFQHVPAYQLVAEEVRDADVVVGSFWTQLHDLGRVEGATRVFFAQDDPFVWDPESLPENTGRLAEASHSQAPVPLLTVSAAMAARLQEVYGRRAEVVPNGIDLGLFRPRSRSVSAALRIMTMGRDSLAFKGVQDVFEAVALLRARGVACELTWVTPEAPETRPADCQVIVAPSQEQLAELYSQMDVFISGSRYESFSLPPLEAMACGTPVVAVDNAGLRTYARDRVNCLLTTAANPQAIADAVATLVKDQELGKRLVAAGRETAASFGWNAIIPHAERSLVRLWLGDLFITNPPNQAMRGRISLCIIARDEAAAIGRCLESVRNAVDEMIVVDTGSQDDTREIARGLGAKVFEARWQNDFSQARNLGIERASGDWILCLDADEELVAKDQDVLRKTIRAYAGAEGLTVPVASLVDETDSTIRVVQESLRLFRNRPEHRFEGAIHEQVAGTIARAGGLVQRTGIPIVHYGYLPSVRRAKQKSDRNTTLLEQEVARNPQDASVHFNLANEYLAVSDVQSARDEYLEAYRLAPASDRSMTYFSRLLHNLIKSYIALGQDEQALATIAEATELYEDYTDLWLLRGQILSRKGDAEGAMEAFERCLQLGDAPAKYFSVQGHGTWVPWYYKGSLLESQGLLAQALAAYGTSLRVQPAYREPAVRLAALCANSELPSAIVEAVEAALQGSDFADELLAQAHYKAHRFTRGARFAERVRTNAPMALALSAGRLAEGDAAGALSALASVAFNGEQASDATKLEIAAAWSQDRWADATVVCGHLADIDSNAARAYLALTQVLEHEAGAATGLNPNDLHLIAAIDLMIDLRLFEVFERLVSSLLALSSPTWRIALGKLLFRKGFKDLAFELLAAIASVDDLDAEALLILGGMAREKGFASEAEAFLRKAQALSAGRLH